MPSELPRRKIRIAISACLLGESVRFNGGHKESRLCSRTLAEYFDYLPLCPEVAIGLGIPREPIRLVGDPLAPRAVGTVDASRDVTAPLEAFAREVLPDLDGVCGYILMQKSPSCGMERVKVYPETEGPMPGGAAGIYARVLQQARPELPMEEDGRLNDPVLRENFLTRVFAFDRWQQLCGQGLTHQGILDFHADYKFQLLATDPGHYKALGRLLADVGNQDPLLIGPEYFRRFMQSLKRPASRGTHTNVLQHLAGYLKHQLVDADRREFNHLISQYQQGLVPLVVPLMLLKHHLRHHPDPYLARQAYLQPHPEALSLRNAI